MALIALLVCAVAFIIVATTVLKLHPFLALIVAAFGYGVLCGTLSLQQVVDAVNSGFGDTISKIGIVILAGAIIGVFLERSGGAYRLAESVLRLTGRGNAPLAMGVMGYVVSVPVFCDSGFVILAPLGRALAHKTGASTAAAAIALSLGLYATHTMVPPTPGPVAAAGILRADLGLVILLGLIVSAVTLLAGWAFAVCYAPRVAPDAASDAPHDTPETPADAPSAGRAALPIVVPLALIVMKSAASLPSQPFGDGQFAVFVQFIGHPAVALLLGVLMACTLPARREPGRYSVQGWVGEAVVAAAVIIVVTGAGGAFGKVIETSGIAGVVQDRLGGAQLGLWLPFLVATALKTAQGSST
ncbi:MAG TPA: SLC13 family permease, partial [Candidatus Hydrogenedentes bacterium]|nr:SLC13 family permease [Candidatus Hydrogenedentota bacterium]